MHDELLYQLALSRIPNIGDVHGKILLNVFGEASAIFKAPLRQLEKIDGIGTVRATAIRAFDDFENCRKEIKFMDDNKVVPLFITDKSYPLRLQNCYDSPLILFYKGNASLNAEKIISIVGTRSNSEYGRSLCEKIVAELSEHDVLIVSGLAFGIDTIAHRAALKNCLSTVGVLAHGHDRLYPSQNKSLSNEMLQNGGLLTDFSSGSAPDRQNFPKRNRIVAGICDALLVVESNKKGGSLITAELANSYNKDVFALPGRANDSRSEGCNLLIKNNKAVMITETADILENMNWLPKKKPVQQQRELFVHLAENEQKIVTLLQAGSLLHVDELYLQSGLSSSAAAEALLILEMNGIVKSLPGKMFKME